MNRVSPSQSGFNLIELLVVIGIIVLLASIGFVYAPTQITRARLAAETTEIVTLATAIENFHADTGRFPAKGQLIAQLGDRKAAADVKWNGPYFVPSGKYQVDHITGPVVDLETGQPISEWGEQIADEWGHPVFYVPKRDMAAYGVANETPFAGSETLFGGSIWVNGNSFILISAGPDGKMRMDGTHFKPLIYGDGRDNDGDGYADEFQVKGQGTGPAYWPEDDIINQ